MLSRANLSGNRLKKIHLNKNTTKNRHYLPSEYNNYKHTSQITRAKFVLNSIHGFQMNFQKNLMLESRNPVLAKI